MKIEVKITNDGLMSISALLMLLYGKKVTTNGQEKVLLSIGYDLADKFDSKAKQLVKKSSLFDTKKRHKITLKYHEAWALEIILIEFLPFHSNEFSKNEVQKVINQLNQKLA
jgi:chromosome condensin MukBEF complex kleisin-like MukF subunit